MDAGISGPTPRPARAADATPSIDGDRFRAIFENAAVGIEQVGLDGRLIDANPRLCELLGYPRDELLGMHFEELTHGDDVAAERARVARLAAGREASYRIEKRALRRDGSSLWVEVRSSAVRDEQGRLLFRTSVVQDVAGGGVAAEKARHDALVRQIISSSPMPMGIVELSDDDSDILHVFDNPATCRFFGVASGGTAGRWDRADLGVPRRTVETWVAAYRASQRSSHPVHFEDRHEHDGAVRWLGVVVTHVGRHASGRDRYCYISEDITERKRSEEEIHRLNRSLERRATELATLIDVLPIGIGIAEDPACTSIRVNPTLAALLRLPPGANASLTAPERERPAGFRVYHDGRPVPGDELPMQTSASKGAVHRDLEFDFVFDDGTTLKLLENVAPLFDEQGRPRGCVGAFLDVTERRKVEAERERLLLALRDDDRRKDEFLAMLAHELRNPLSAISNAAQLMKAKEPADPDLRWCRDVIQRQAHHLSRLLDDLLDVSRISRGKVSLRRQTLDLRETIRRAAETTRPLVDQKRHALDVRLPDEPLIVEADPARMEQVLVNLLGNAAKYSEEGGRINVVAERDGRDAIVRVKDCGMGISPDALARVFDLFAQAETSIDRSQGGLGVGLTIVKSLVELHGGVVSATSEGFGLGSEFVVRLPALEPVAAEAAGPPAEPGAGSRARRVVVVDDNVDANLSIARVLEGLGHEVESAYDGPSALELVDAFRPGVVLLDIGLPGMDGYEVAARLRKRPLGERLVVIAVTGYGQEGDRLRSRAAGIDHHLVKPVELHALLAILDDLPAAD